MTGTFIFIGILLLIIVGMIVSLKKGVLVMNNPNQSIPIEYEVLTDHNIPLITLTAGNNRKYTFIVDSGASDNYLNKAVLAEIAGDVAPSIKGKFYGADGKPRITESYELLFTYRRAKYLDTYLVTDLSAMVENLKEDIKQEIHGVLGVSFLKAHGMSVDINRMIVWKKL